MRSQCGPPKFDKQDWSKFDFSRWHLEGISLDSAAAAVGEQSEKLFNSEEWRQNFQVTLPELQLRALDAFKEHSKDLRQQRTAAAEDFDNRATAAQQRSDDFRKSMETATAPPVVEPSPDAFHVAVRVVSEQDPRLGLPGITVQIVDPRNEKAVLVESFTDNDGNAVLTVPPELAKERDKHDTALHVVDPAGKPLAKLANAVCIRVGQTETRVVKVGEAATIAENNKLALEIRAEREARARNLAGRSEVLKNERQKVLEEFDCRLQDNEAIIAELEKPETPPQPEEPIEEAEFSPGTEPADEEPPPTQLKRRKKRLGDCFKK